MQNSGNSYSKKLYAMGKCFGYNDNDWRPITISWSASDFSIYESFLNGLFNGEYSQRTLVLDVPDTNYSQSDSGFITIDTAGLSWSIKLVIIDTTNYHDPAIENGNNAKIITEFKVSPNPFNPSVTISVPFTRMDKGIIQIYDIQGKIVFQKRIRGQERIAWNAAGLSNGIYLLKARIGEKIYSRKLILNR